MEKCSVTETTFRTVIKLSLISSCHVLRRWCWQ